MGATPKIASKPAVGLKLGRWILAALVLGGLGVGAVWGAGWLMAPTTLPLERIRVEGNIRHTRRELLEHTLAGRLSGGFFSLDLDQVRSAVEELPWVTRSSVRRIWPSTLAVWVQEREALARWGNGGVVSPEGEVFVPEPGTVPKQLVHLLGPEDSALEVVQGYKSMHRRFSGQELGISRLELSERGAWTLDLNSGVRLYLGNSDVERRLDRFLDHLPGLNRRGQLEQVDARYSNGFAVRWKPLPETVDMKAGAEG